MDNKYEYENKVIMGWWGVCSHSDRRDLGTGSPEFPVDGRLNFGLVNFIGMSGGR